MTKYYLLTFFLIAGALGYAHWAKTSLHKNLGTEGESLLTMLPAVQFQTLTGETRAVSELAAQSGRGVLIHFWATWCGPCEAELPEIIQFTQTLPRETKLLLVAVNDDKAKVKKFISQLALKDESRLEWLMDDQQIHREKFGTAKLPETYLFDPQGKFLRKFVGPQEWAKPHFLDILLALLP